MCPYSATLQLLVMMYFIYINGLHMAINNAYNAPFGAIQTVSNTCQMKLIEIHKNKVVAVCYSMKVKICDTLSLRVGSTKTWSTEHKQGIMSGFNTSFPASAHVPLLPE